MDAGSMSRGRLVAMGMVCLVSALAVGSGEAAEVLSNPGFEAGVLAPWTTDGNWAIETNNCHSGSYCASNDGNNSIKQTFPGIPTSSITGITFWMRQPNASISAFRLGYSDGSSYEDIVSPSSSWSQFDITSHLDSGKSLTSLTIWGYQAGGGGPFVTVLDDVSIQTNLQPTEAIPLLGWRGVLALALALGVAGAILIRRRLA